MKTRHRRPFIYWFAHLVLPTYYKLVFHCAIRGKENIPKEGPVILVSNHVTARDPLFLGAASRRQIHYMAKASLFKNKFLAWIIRYAGAFPVERGTGDTDALQEAYRLLEEDRIVGVFIEGTRSKDGEPLKPKTGVSLLAFRTHATVVPVSIIAEDGTCPVPWKKKMMVNIGRPVPFEELNIPEESSMHFRRAAKLIMEKIVALRLEAIERMGGKPSNT